MITGMPTIMAVNLRDVGLYLSGRRRSGVGSMTRGRGVRCDAGAGAAKDVGARGMACLGDGARRGARGRGMVVARAWESMDGGGAVRGVRGACVGVLDGCGFEGVDGEGEGAAGTFIVPVARTWSRILLVAGVAGVGWWAAIDGSGLILSSAAIFIAFIAWAFPGVVLCGEVIDVVCRAGASFGVIVFAVCAGAFFSFSALTTFSLPAVAFMLAFFVPVVFPCVAVVPGASSTTFFGRPRFFAAVGSVDIARLQLVAVV
jgi:hypothetical protein